MAEFFTSRITVDKTIVSLLSKFTYERSFPYALREVVSNAYDADATTVRIEIDPAKDKVVIHDNGTGMTRTEFDFYLRIAGQIRGKRETPKFGRKRIGQFGVGFLAILPFCGSLQITSTTENSEEVFSADIPAWKFFRQEAKPVEVGEVEVTGEIIRSARAKAQHFTQITLQRLTDIAQRYFHQKSHIERKDRVTGWPPMDRLRWELQEDLPLAFAQGSELNTILAYPESMGMDVYFQGDKLVRNSVQGEVIDHGDLSVEGVELRYAIATPWKAVRPFELRGMKIRLNNVGVGPRQVFGVEIGRKYSRLHWLSGEVQVVRGLDGAIALSRDSFVATPEYEGVCAKLDSILRKWADYVETVDVAARDMTKQLRGGKQVSVAAKKEVVDRNIRALADRGFVVRRIKERSDGVAGPVHVDRTKKEVVVYEQHPDLEDTISIDGRKRRILYVRSPGASISYENACRVNKKGELEIETQYPLFRSKRYGDLFKKIYIIAALAKEECSSPTEMYKFILSHLEKEFSDF
jgi:ketosteroid isomerase-like protein